jgi:GT2 family glycosyltransferase
MLNLVSVIIVNWNGRKFLPECLESLRHQTYRRFSTIIVDNGSNDGSIDFVIRNYPEVKTIALPKNLGFSVANNIAIKTVHTEYVALLNNDAVAHSLWLQSLMKALESCPEAGFAASKMLYYDNPAQHKGSGLHS